MARAPAEVANALAALRNLAETQRSRELIASNGIPAIVKFAALGTHAQKTFAAGVLWHLSESSECQAAIGEAGGVEALVELARYGEDVQRENATGALMKLAELEANRERIVDAGGVEVLMGCVQGVDVDDDVRPRDSVELAGMPTDNANSLEAEKGGFEEIGFDRRLENDPPPSHVDSAREVTAAIEEQDDTINSPAEDGEVTDDKDCDIRVLLQQLSGASRDEKIETLKKLCGVSESNELVWRIVNSGGLPILAAKARESDQECCTLAVRIMGNLCQDAALQLQVAEIADVSILIRMTSGSEDEKKQAILLVEKLAVVSSSVRIAISKPKEMALIISLLSSSNEDTKCAALCTLFHLVEAGTTPTISLRSEELEALFGILEKGTEAQTSMVARVLAAHPSKTDIENAIGQQTSVTVLVVLVRDGTPDHVKAALKKLVGIQHAKIVQEILRASCVPSFVKVFQDPQYDISDWRRALSFLASITSNQEGAAAILSTRAPQIFVNIIKSGESLLIPQACLALYRLSAVGKNGETLAEAGSIPAMAPLLQRVQSIQTHAVKFMYHLSTQQSCARRVAESDCIPRLIELLAAKQEAIRVSAIGTLMHIFSHEALQNEFAGIHIISELVGKLNSGSSFQKTHVCSLLLRLANSIERQDAIGACGGIPMLVSLLNSRHAMLSLEAASLLTKIVATECNRAIVLRDNIIENLIIGSSSNLPRINTAKVLSALAEDSRMEQVLLTISRTKAKRPELIEAGMIQLSAMLLNVVGKRHKAATFAEILVNLAEEVDHHALFLKSEVIVPLITLIRVGTDKDKQHAAGVLAALAVSEGNCMSIQSAGAISSLLTLLRGRSELAEPNAALAISKLAETESCRLAIQAIGGVTLLRNASSGGNAEVKSRIERALELLDDDEVEGEILSSSIRSINTSYQTRDNQEQEFVPRYTPKRFRMACRKSVPTSWPSTSGST